MDTHVVLSGSEKSAPRAKKFSGLDGNEIIQVTLRLHPPIDAPDADRLIAARRRCARENYETIFGVRAEAVAAVEKFARKFNLSVVDKKVSARTVTLSGSVQHMQEAFFRWFSPTTSTPMAPHLEVGPVRSKYRPSSKALSKVYSA